MALRGADPGGEYFFSRTGTQLLAENILIDMTNFVVVNNAPVGWRSTRFAWATNTTGGAKWLGRLLGGNFQDSVVGFANYNPTGIFTNNTVIFTVTDGTTHQVELCTDASGHLFFRRNGTAIGGVSTNALTGGGSYIEVKSHIAGGTAGSCEVRVNGSVWLTVTGVNTQATANAYANRFYLQPISAPTNVEYFKDIYWRDDTTYLGDRTVNVIYPSAAGPSQQWSPSSGTQVGCIQDGILGSGTIPDDSNYITDTVSGHVSDFVPQAITVPGGGSIDAVIHVSRVGGSANVKQYTKSGGTTHTTSTIATPLSPAYFFDIMETDPNTGSAWTQSGVNAATHGVQIP